MGDAESDRSVDFSGLRHEVDLPSLIMADVHLFCRAGNLYEGPCPLHGGKNNSFKVFRARKDGSWRFRCYSKCKQHGDAVDYLMFKHGYTYAEALERLDHTPRAPAPRTPSPAPPEPEPLDWSVVEKYARLVDLPIDPSGRDQTTALDHWHDRGYTDATIERFYLGFCPNCRTAYDPAAPRVKHPSLTFPVFYTAEARKKVLQNVRHRLIQTKKGDKYRPEAAARGVHVFNLDSIRRAKERGLTKAFNIEGEGKVIASVQEGLEEHGAVITLTGGAGSWIGTYGERYAPQLEGFDVYTLLDVGMETVAEQTATLWGRRGYFMLFPWKLDDWLLEGRPADGAANPRIDMLLDLLPQAYQARPKRYFWTPPA